MEPFPSGAVHWPAGHPAQAAEMMGVNQHQYQLSLQHQPQLTQQQGWTAAQQQYWQQQGMQGVLQHGWSTAQHQQEQSQPRESLQRLQALLGLQSQGFPAAQQQPQPQWQRQQGLQSQGWSAAQQQQQQQQASAGRRRGGLNIHRRHALPGRPNPVQGPVATTATTASAPAGANEEQDEEADGGFGDGLEEQSYTAVSTADLELLGLRRHPDAIAECASLRCVAAGPSLGHAEEENQHADDSRFKAF